MGTAAEMLRDVLQRQQAQLKIAENQLKNAQRNSAGHIRGDAKESSEKAQQRGFQTVKEDLRLMCNSDGHWDEDSDEEVDTDNKEHESGYGSGPSITMSANVALEAKKK